MRLLRRIGKPLIIFIPLLFLLMRFLPGILDKMDGQPAAAPEHPHPSETGE